jgi:hypothetical protein
MGSPEALLTGKPASILAAMLGAALGGPRSPSQFAEVRKGERQREVPGTFFRFRREGIYDYPVEKGFLIIDIDIEIGKIPPWL